MALSTTQYGYIIDPMVPFTDDKGKTIKNGFVRVFVAGSSTPVVTYRNFDGATNQDRIELDNSGRTRTSVIGSKGLTYKVCVYDKHHSQESPILTVDKVSAIGANITAGAGATVVTGLDGLTTKPDGFVDASVVGTDGYVAIDHTLVTDDLDTDSKVTAVEDDRYVPLLNEDVNDPDSKMTLGRLWQWVLGKIKSLSTTITDFRTGDVIPVDGPSGTAKMGKDSLLAIARDGLAEKDEITNIYDDATFGTQGFIGGDGVVHENADFERTDYIPLEEGDFILYSLYEYAITGDAPASMAIFAFYDSAKTFISSVTQIAGTNGFINGKFDTIPANTKFVRISNKSNVNPYGWAHVYTFSSSKFATLKGVVDSLPPEDVPYNGRIIKAIGKDIDEWADYGWDDESVLTSIGNVANVYFERNIGRKHPSLVTRVRYYSKVGFTATLYKIVLNGTRATTTSVMTLGDGTTSGWINYDVSIPLKENEYLGINGKFVYKVGGDSFGDEKITEISSGTTGTWVTGALGLFYEGLVEDGIAVRLDEFAQYSINGGDHKLLPSAVVDGATATFDPFSIPMDAGYVADDGSIASEANPAFGHIRIDVHGIKTLTMNGSGGGIGTIHHAVLVFPDGQIRTFFGANASGVLAFTFKKEFVGKLYLNRFGGATPISNGNWSIEYYSKEQMSSFDLRMLPDIVRKPFGDWSTKKVCFCGDSIVKGYTSGGTTTTYTWPYWLNEKLSFSSYDNVAVGGSCYQNIDGHNWVYRQIQNARSSGYDVIFVGCGINDYVIGGDISDFVDAVNNILDYINTYYPNTTQFIFVTPINEAGWNIDKSAYRFGVSSLDDYRFAIQSCVTKKDTYHRFSVLDGKRFGFPTIECDDSAFVYAVFGDKLHPSENGYADIYAPAVLERIV